MPTGYGKSLLFELIPVFWSLVFKKTVKVLILSPLNAIIEQQQEVLGKRAYVLKKG